MYRNTNPAYWHENYPYLLSALQEVTGDELSANAQHLSYIAGDYLHMSDDEVIATIINENLPRPASPDLEDPADLTG